MPRWRCHVALGSIRQADSRRVMTFANEDDVISFRHHMYEARRGKECVLHEVGPRFEMQLYQLRLGTLDQVCLWLLFSSFGVGRKSCQNTTGQSHIRDSFEPRSVVSCLVDTVLALLMRRVM